MKIPLSTPHVKTLVLVLPAILFISLWVTPGASAARKAVLTLKCLDKPLRIEVSYNGRGQLPLKACEVTLNYNPSIVIYDIRGGLVRRIDLGHQSAGHYLSRGRTVHWDGKNRHGETVRSGVYFYRFQAGSLSDTGKIVISK